MAASPLTWPPICGRVWRPYAVIGRWPGGGNRAHHGIGARIEHFARIEGLCPNGYAILPLCAPDNSGNGSWSELGPSPGEFIDRYRHFLAMRHNLADSDRSSTATTELSTFMPDAKFSMRRPFRTVAVMACLASVVPARPPPAASISELAEGPSTSLPEAIAVLLSL
jgi:hypothetical protein